MADMSDVERALVATLGSALFPTLHPYLSGDYQPSVAYGSIVTKLYRGWPESANLNADLALGRAHVSVFPEPGMTRIVSRWFPAGTQQVVTANVPTITATISGVTVTLGGTVSAGNVVGIQFGVPIAAYAYIAQAGDTLTTIAATLATKSGATSSGAVITLPTPLYSSVGVMVPQSVYTVMRQQQQGFRVSVWASTPSARDSLSALCDLSLASLVTSTGQFTRFMPVNAYEAAKIDYRSTFIDDKPARDRVWRRDLCYTVEYPTCFIEQDPAAMFFGGPLWPEGNSGVLTQWGAVEPSNSVFASPDENSIFIDAAGNIIGVQPTS